MMLTPTVDPSGPDTDAPIGVFDSGVGGLTVLRALREALPHESLLYLGDTARLPYGTKSPETVVRYAEQAARVLARRGVKLLVIACNTASAVALDHLAEVFRPLPVVGVVEPGAAAACRASKTGQIVVIATEGTVRGGAYERAIRARRPDAVVLQVPCSLFVALAEEGWVAGPIAEAIAHRYLDAPLAELPGADCLVLGCTHFPVLRAAISAAVNKSQVSLIDSAETTALAVVEILASRGIARRPPDPATGAAPAWTRFLATDAPARFARVGTVFFGSAPESHEDGHHGVELVDL